MLKEDEPHKVYVTPKEASTNDESRVKSTPEAKDEYMDLWSQPLCKRRMKSWQEGHLPHLQEDISLQMKYSLFDEEKTWKKLFKDKKKLWWIHKETLEKEDHVLMNKPEWSWAQKHPTSQKKMLKKHKSNDAAKSNSGAGKGTLT